MRHRSLLAQLTVLAALLWTATASADDTPAAKMSISAKGGVTIFTNAQSFALEHLLKPSVRLEFAYRLHERFSVAVEVMSVIDSGAGYHVVGGFLNGRFHTYDGDLFDLDLVLGGGLGRGAPILFDGLNTNADVVAYVQGGVQLRWTVVPGHFALGLDLMNENLLSASANGVAVVHF